MRITIIKNDNHVYIDGIAYDVDCSGLPDNFHALQWYHTWGDIETQDERFRHQNTPLEGLSELEHLQPYQHLVDQAVAKKAVRDAALAAAAARREQQKALKEMGGHEVKIIAG